MIPSVLLSEGFCPAGHGKLDREKVPGWCKSCGLVFIMHSSGVEDWGNFVDVCLELPTGGEVWVLSVDDLDQIYDLNARLEWIYQKLAQWRNATY
jgi:hypothetical protein